MRRPRPDGPSRPPQRRARTSPPVCWCTARPQPAGRAV